MYDFQMPLFGGDGTLYWSIRGGSRRRSADSLREAGMLVDLAVVNKQSKGWLGIGLPPAAYVPGTGHNDTDMWVARVDPSNATNVLLTDQWSPVTGQPVLDTTLGGQNNLIYPQGIITPTGLMYIAFRRMLVTGDRFDQPVNTTALSPCLFAFFDQDNSFGYHGRGNVMTITCNWGNVTVTPRVSPPFPYNLLVAHAVLGSIGVGLLLTMGAFWLRYCGCIRLRLTTVATAVIFVLGAVLLVLSLLLAGVMVSQSTGLHYTLSSASNGAHAYTALACVIASVVFVVLRLVTCDMSGKPATNDGDAAFGRLAQYAGYAVLAIAILVGWPTIFLGFVDQRNLLPWMWVIGGIAIGVAVLFFAAEVMYCFKTSPHPRDEVEQGIAMK